MAIVDSFHVFQEKEQIACVHSRTLKMILYAILNTKIAIRKKWQSYLSEALTEGYAFRKFLKVVLKFS